MELEDILKNLSEELESDSPYLYEAKMADSFKSFVNSARELGRKMKKLSLQKILDNLKRKYPSEWQYVQQNYTKESAPATNEDISKAVKTGIVAVMLALSIATGAINASETIKITQTQGLTYGDQGSKKQSIAYRDIETGINTLAYLEFTLEKQGRDVTAQNLWKAAQQELGGDIKYVAPDGSKISNVTGPRGLKMLLDNGVVLFPKDIETGNIPQEEYNRMVKAVKASLEGSSKVGGLTRSTEVTAAR